MNQTILIAILTPILVTIGGLVTWFLKTRKDSLQAIEERAREKRLKTYETITEPLIMMLGASGNAKTEQKATNTILSLEYKKAGFNLVTFGSDEMVRTYNKMMQHFYQENSETDPNFTTNTMKVFCDFLLAIRRDLNYPNTKLKRSDTLEFLVKGIDSLELD